MKTEMTSVTEVYGSGQKVVAAIIEYGAPVSAQSLAPDCFKVDGRTITGVTVSESCHGSAVRQGRFVELTLDSSDENASTKEMIGQGRHSRMGIRPQTLTVSQLKPVAAANGETLPAFSDMQTTRTDNGIVDSFSVHRYQVPASTRFLDYNLYMPPNGVPGRKYPLVLFMHDAGTCSDEVSAPLVQGSGAVVWAREAELGVRQCYVLAPHYPEVCANDDFEVTWQAGATIDLIKNLCAQFPVDKSRIYGTGQSMGCMMLCEMLLRHPAFFAGSLLVAGQWNPETMSAAKDAAIWSVVSSGDEKAFPIMSDCLDNMEKAGGRLSKSHIDARCDASAMNAAIYRQKELGCNLNFTYFEGSGILPHDVPEHPGMHHICTWRKAYDIEALREWLFEQRINWKWSEIV